MEFFLLLLHAPTDNADLQHLTMILQGKTKEEKEEELNEQIWNALGCFIAPCIGHVMEIKEFLE